MSNFKIDKIESQPKPTPVLLETFEIVHIGRVTIQKLQKEEITWHVLSTGHGGCIVILKFAANCGNYLKTWRGRQGLRIATVCGSLGGQGGLSDIKKPLEGTVPHKDVLNTLFTEVLQSGQVLQQVPYTLAKG